MDVCLVVVALIMKYLFGVYFSTIFAVVVYSDDRFTSTPNYENNDFTLRAVPLSPNSALIQWDSIGNDTKGWLLRVLAHRDLIFTANINYKTKEHVMVGLQPKTTYIVKLARFTKGGDILTAVPVTVTTLAAEPGIVASGKRRNNNGNDNDDDNDDDDDEAIFRRLVFRNESETKEEVNFIIKKGKTTKIKSTKEKAVKPDDDNTRLHNGVVKWALIAFGSALAAFLFVFFIFFLLHKAQRKNDFYSIRRRSRKGSSIKKLTPGTGKTDETKGDNEVITLAIGRREEGEGKDGDDEEERKDEFASIERRKNQPALLQVPHMEFKPNRGTTCSVLSWGSEFDIPEGDTIYNNELPSRDILSSNPRTADLSPRTAGLSPSYNHQEDNIYSNSTPTVPSPPPPPSSSQQTRPNRHLTLQATRNNTTLQGTANNVNPDGGLQQLHKAQTLPDRHFNFNEVLQRQNYTTSEAASASSMSPTHYPTSNWNNNNNKQGLDMVIPTSPKHQSETPNQQKAYSNIPNSDELYVNSKDINSCLPPPIPRR